MPPLNLPALRFGVAILALIAVGLLTGSAKAADVVPGEVVVDLRGDNKAEPTVLKTDNVAATIRQLRARPDVRYAVPNVIAHATAVGPFIPNDPGQIGKVAGWRATQWYLDGPFSINAIGGWNNLIAARRPGASGVKIAVLDSGVAYRAAPPRRASPELPRTRFLQGYDFIDGDTTPTDEFGHGTMVAAIIAAETNNAIGFAGIAYKTRILPVRVLDAEGNGDATAIARGVRFAVKRGVKVMNLSLEFPEEYTAKDVPQLLDALAYARKRGVLVVVAAGNTGLDRLPYPGRASTVMAVGAITQHGCLAEYSNYGKWLDIVAPGGGRDGEFPDPGCAPNEAQGKGITQLSLVGERHTKLAATVRSGTSMASPQVAAVAAAVIASGVIGRNPTPARIQLRLQRTARDLGPKGDDPRYANGLVDMAAATAPKAARLAPAPVPAPVPTP